MFYHFCVSDLLILYVCLSFLYVWFINFICFIISVCLILSCIWFINFIWVLKILIIIFMWYDFTILQLVSHKKSKLFVGTIWSIVKSYHIKNLNYLSLTSVFLNFYIPPDLGIFISHSCVEKINYLLLLIL